MRRATLLAGAALALTSALALAQGAPESLLPPGFNEPAPAPSPAASATAGTPRATSTSAPVVQPLPAQPGFELPVSNAPGSGDTLLKRLPSLDELSRMSPEDFQNILGLKPDFDMPVGARRAMSDVGLIDQQEGGLPANSLSGQNQRLVRLALAANNGQLVSRWGHILLRRALASRLDPPPGMSPQEFLALRVRLLLKMGESDAARALLQDIDVGDYTPDLDGVVLDAYIDTADFTGVCPALATQGGVRDDPQWNTAKAICSAFRGNGAGAMATLDRYRFRGTMPRIDLLLAQKYAGAAGRSRRAVTIEWQDASELTPWRYALANAVGLTPPDSLTKDAAPYYAYATALAPMVGLERRAAAADQAGAAGVLSSAALVDLYSQMYADPDVTGDWSDRAEKLRDAYVQDDAPARLAAIKSLWGTSGDPVLDYSRKVLTAYAAARLPATADFADDAAPLIASMLTAGLDANAMRWADAVNAGSEGWALLVLAAPSRSSEVDSGSIDKFISGDKSEEARKSGFLIAGLAGLGRIDSGAAGRYSADHQLGLGTETRWTRAIEEAARSNDVVTVALLAGLGMQGLSWKQMTPRYLFHIVSALRAVGLEGEARMIAAEAVARA